MFFTKGGRRLFSEFSSRIAKKISSLTDKLKSFDTKVVKKLHIEESYTASIIKKLLFMPDINPGIAPQRIKEALLLMISIVTAVFALIPGGVLFALVIIMYFLFVAEYTWSYKKCKVSSFDVLLTLFCAATLFAASMGKSIWDALEACAVYGSFMLLYFVIVNTADSREMLFRLKLIFCVVGSVMAVIQLTQSILSYEMKVLGQIYVLAAPMDFELFFMTKNRRLKCLLVAMAFLKLIALTVCWSGGSWVWATFVLAFFIVIKDWRLLLIGGVGLLFIPFIMPYEIIDFHKLMSAGISEYLFAPSADYRVSAYGALKAIFEYYRAYPSLGRWHSSVIVFACIVILLMLILRELAFGMKGGQMGMVLALLSAVGFGVTGILYSDITSGMWDNYKALFVFWIYTSIYAADSRIGKKSTEEGDEQEPKRRFCFIDTIPLLLCIAYISAAL